MNFSSEEIEALALSDFITEPPPPPGDASDKVWFPLLTPAQQRIFDDPSPNVLAAGEKGSGKSVGCAHKLVRHCYEAGDPKKMEPLTALAIIIVRTYGSGDMGIWYDFEHLILPQWRDGNRQPKWLYTGPEDGDRRNPDYWKENPDAYELIDNGIGLVYTASKNDIKTKASRIDIKNRFGTWSRVVLLSIPYSVQIADRMKGPAPSFIYVEELTDCENRQYHSYPSAQLDRRRGTGVTPHQYVASCNPEGPSHWVYELFEPDNPEARNPDFAYHHVPFTDNIPHVGPKYLSRLANAFKHDPTEADRLIGGLWVDRPSGRPLFQGFFVSNIHIKPAPGTKEYRDGHGLTPKPGFPIIVSHDPGPANYSVHFMQILALLGDQVQVLVFDEINCVGRYLLYSTIVPIMMRRMLFWAKLISVPSQTTPGLNRHIPVSFENVADEAAFNQVRSDGKFDNLVIERESRDWFEQQVEKDPTIKRYVSPIVLKPCPKGNDSLAARTQMLMSLLQTEQIMISARCVKTIEMFNRIEPEDPKEGKYDAQREFRPKSGIFRHPFDSLTYGLFYKQNFGGLTAVVRTRKLPAPKVYEMR